MSDVGITSNQYGYGLDPVFLSLLSSFASKDQSKQTDYMQNLLSLLLDPKFAATSGNFDPMLVQPQQFTPTYGPTLLGALNSPTPVLSQIAQSIIAGQIDPMNAAAEMAAALNVKRDEYGDTPNAQGLTYASIEDMVSKMFAEAGDVREAEANFYADQQKAISENVFSKAGLPQPTESYTMETVPRTSSQSAMLRSIMSEAEKVGRERSAISETASEAEKVARGRFDKAGQAEPKGRVLEAGVPLGIDEAASYAAQIGVKEDWFVDKWIKAKANSGVPMTYDEVYKYYKSFGGSIPAEASKEAQALMAGSGGTPKDLADSLKRIMQSESRDKSMIDYAFGANNVDQDRAKKILGYLESGKFELKPRQMEPSKDEAGEVQRFRNVAGVQAGQRATDDQQKAMERRQNALDFKSGLASAMLAGSARGRNAVTSPLQDALLSRLKAGLGM